MDSSNTSGMNGTHLQQQYHGGSSFNNFINDIEAYANDDAAPGTDDFAGFAWDPALFAGGEPGSSFSQQQQQQPPQQSIQANLNQTLTRQSNSPALQPHHPSHSQYPQNNYSHSLYEHRNMAQPSFDERFMSRPSASPVSFEQHHSAYQQMPFASYNFQQPYPRQSSPPNPYYQQRPAQQSQQMMNLNPRQPSQLSQTPQMDNMQMHQFPGNQRMTHTFVNPSMVNTSHMVAMNGNQQANHNAQSRQQYPPSPYFQKAGSTVDPQALHSMQMQNYPSMPAAQHQILPQPSAQHQTQQGHAQQQIQSLQMVPQQITLPQMATASKPAKDPNAPKKPRSKAAKAKKDNTAESDSSDDLEIEDEPPEVKPALLVVAAPTDEKGRALYNAVEAVWYPRNKSPQAEDVRRGIAAFGETVRSLRDAWKAKNDTLKQAELPNSGLAPQIPRLKEDVAHYRQTMESVISRSLQYGHDAIVKRLGENQFTLSALYSFLLDRANVIDYDSTLVNSIFKFAVKFETLDEEMLEQVKWTKVLQRWTKKATNESKEHARQILANAAAQTNRKKLAKVDGTPGSPSSYPAARKDATAGVKRSRDGESVGAPAPKKIVKPASKPLALQSIERRKALEKESLQKAGTAKTDRTAIGSSSVASRPKVAMTAPPKANAFASLLSASKKPGTTNAEKAAAAAVKEKPFVSSTVASNGPLATVKKEEAKKESPPRSLGPATTKTASSFLGFLADMDKPKETETKKVDVDPNETAEQRTKRLRKEARRKLRVTWRPDNDLVQVKLFTHDPEEETGQTDSMMRDAGDTMKEGEMLKRHIAMEDMDDEEEDESAAVDESGEYSPPSAVDFSPISPDQAGNYLKLGGSLKPESAASVAQANYEEDTLMTTYATTSDRPDTPKELPSINDDDDDFQPEADFGDPGPAIRGKERELTARKQSVVPTVTGNVDLAAQLRALGAQAQAQAQSQTQVQAPVSVFNPFNAQTVAPPVASQMPAGLDLSKLLAVMQQAKQMQQAQPPQPPAQIQPQPQPQPQPQSQSMYQPSTTGISPNVAAILAQVTGQQSTPLPLGNSGNPNPYPGSDDNSRKHARSEDGNDSSGKKKKKGGAGPDGKPYNYKTIVCSFWQEGKCTKGDSCTYKHEM